jgi:hypothetical protein
MRLRRAGRRDGGCAAPVVVMRLRRAGRRDAAAPRRSS